MRSILCLCYVYIRSILGLFLVCIRPITPKRAASSCFLLTGFLLRFGLIHSLHVLASSCIVTQIRICLDVLLVLHVSLTFFLYIYIQVGTKAQTRCSSNHRVFAQVNTKAIQRQYKGNTKAIQRRRPLSSSSPTSSY